MNESPDFELSDAHYRAFREHLLDWYADAKREMPWRGSDEPYHIWLSEVMLQQTRVDQAQPYFNRFVDELPTVEALAEADRDKVLQLWEGLGYYSRARYLHDAAQLVVREHDGTVPKEYDAFRELPGVGPYTAAAVLSIAFGKPHAVVDGNVKRVLSRVFAIKEEIGRAGTKRKIQNLADELLAEDAPADFNQAMMELGATICTPRSPECGVCPLAEVCSARAEGNPEAYPVKKAKAAIPHHDVAVGIIFDEDDKVLIQQRPEDGMLGGLWEFPGGKLQDGEDAAEACRREIREETNLNVQVEKEFHRLKHAYSHFKITLHAFLCSIQSGTLAAELEQPFRWVSVSELDEYAIPRANRKLVERLQKREKEPMLFD